MARVTVEDCLARVPNRFALTILASRRARALSEGRGRAMVDCENKDAVTALREVSADRVRFKEDVEETLAGFIEEQRRQLRVTTGEHTFLEAASLRALEDDDIDLDEDGPADDVEELQTDPEALNKQATNANSDDDEEEEEEEDDDEDDSDDAADDDPTFDADEADLADDDDSDGDSDDDDEEDEAEEG